MGERIFLSIIPETNMSVGYISGLCEKNSDGERSLVGMKVQNN